MLDSSTVGDARSANKYSLNEPRKRRRNRRFCLRKAESKLLKPVNLQRDGDWKTATVK